MTTITVSNSSELSAALNSAHAGDTFLLKAGVYSPVSVTGLNVGGITIASADPTHQATITGLQINNSSGIVVKNLDVFATTGSDKSGVLGVYQATNVTFDHLKVHGSLDGNALNDTDGLRIKLSDNIVVTNSEFQQLRIGIGFGDSTNVKIAGNYIHQISMDGIHGGGTSNMVIANNYITDFAKLPNVHADGIQFYTGNIVKVVHDITITGNVISQGAGEQIQGIFMRNEDAAGRFNKVVVSDNLVLGGNTNGIAVGSATDLRVTNNTVVSQSGDLSWLRVGESDGTVVVTGNSAALFMLDTGGAITQSGNVTNIKATDDGSSELRDWLGAHTTLKSLLPGIVTYTADHAALPSFAGVTAVVSAGSVTLGSVAQSVTLTGALNADAQGNASNNLMTGNVGNNQLLGMAGNDTLEGGSGDDTLDGGSGIDTVSYEHATAGVRMGLLRTNTATNNSVTQDTGGAGKDTLIDVENLTGSAFADTLSGDSGVNTLLGGAGDDILEGNSGNDVLDGGAGGDRLSGGDGNDTLIGGAGADTFTSDVGADRLVGGEGADRFTFDSAGDSTVALSGRDVIADFQSGDLIDLKKLGSFKLVTQFSSTAGQVTANLEGDHYVVQGDIDGDGKADFAINVFSQKALVAADFLGVTAGATINNQATINVVDPTIAAAGTSGNDNMRGGAGADKLTGLAGNDILDGGAGADWMDGGDGADTLIGGAGADTIIGGLGADRMTGGDGADRFQFSALGDASMTARDTIADFQPGDLIDLKKMDADITSNDSVFKLVAKFTHVAGQLTANLDGDHYLVQGDVNGDGLADFAINVYSAKALVAADFLF